MGLEAGAIIASRYQLDRVIGEGGMGVVWAATHVVTRRPVALKFLKGSSPEQTKRFLREARIAGMLGHPHIVQVHDVLELPEDGTPTMVMELLAGESLDARLERGGRIPLGELVALMLPVVSAVGAAHAIGVVHRDLKPDNIFLATSPHAPLDVKVLDFGIAKLTATEGDAASTSGLTQTGAVMGTPYYMAPEQVFGESKIDARADVWSLGVILYECLSGKRPIEGDNFGQIFKNIAMGEVVPVERHVPSVPAAIASLIGRMLTRDKEKRPADLREVYSVLSRYRDASAERASQPMPAAASVPPPFGEPNLQQLEMEAASAAPAPSEIGHDTGKATAKRRESGDSIGGAAAAVTGGRGGRPRGAWIGIAAAVVLAAASVSVGAWRYTRPGPAASAASLAATGPGVGAGASAVVAAAPAAAPAAPPAPLQASAPSGAVESPAPIGVAVVAPAELEPVAPAGGGKPASSGAKPRAAVPVKAAARADKKALPGGIHGDSPY
jgi:hypothetical protein